MFYNTIKYMNSLTDIIKNRILFEGPIGFDKFMDICLYYPELGYYSKPDMIIGKGGDFFTSSHLHSLFGAIIAKQIMEMWELMGKPDDFSIVEMGAGMGYLALDVFSYLSAINKKREISAFYNALSYKIIEISPYLIDKQKNLLNKYSDKMTWHPDIESLPEFTGCFLSNELLDAYPVKIIEQNEKLSEIYVDLKDEVFTEIKRDVGSEILEYLNEFNIKLTTPFRTEINLYIKKWIETLNSKLKKGFILTIDYGYPTNDYYGDHRNRGTLMCYHRHTVNENPYLNIGEQDITAHINFSALKKYGENLGMNSIGFTNQSTFLISLGIEEVIKEIYQESEYPQVMSKIKGLFLPQGLGETHKVFIQCKNIDEIPKLNGFKIRNRLHWL